MPLRAFDLGIRQFQDTLGVCRMQSKHFRTGKLIAVGPITTTPLRLRVEVGTQGTLSQDHPECTCVFCRSIHTQNQTTPVSLAEDRKSDDRHTPQ